MARHGHEVRDVSQKGQAQLKSGTLALLPRRSRDDLIVLLSSVRLTFEQIQLVGRIRGKRVRGCECKQLMQWCCLEQGQAQDL